MHHSISKESPPAPDRLAALGVTSWPIWTKEISTFPWIYDSEETCYFLEGEVVVTPEGGGVHGQRRSRDLSARHELRVGSAGAGAQALPIRVSGARSELELPVRDDACRRCPLLILDSAYS